jgi:hypothetical protein
LAVIKTFERDPLRPRLLPPVCPQAETQKTVASTSAQRRTLAGDREQSIDPDINNLADSSQKAKATHAILPPMFRRIDIALQVAVAVAWLVLVALLLGPAPKMAAALFFGGLVLGFVSIKATRKARQLAREPRDERSARLMVTRMLKELTLVQLAYLKQQFATSQQGKRWLQNALPRTYRPALDDLVVNLEAVGRGESNPAVQLVVRLRALADELRAVDDELDRAAKTHKGADIARPAVFVITEDVGDGEHNEPRLVTMAAWVPKHETLLPRCEQLTIIDTDAKGKRSVMGQLDFDQVEQRLGKKWARVSGSKAPDVFAAGNVMAEVQELGPREIPLGFVVSVTDL